MLKKIIIISGIVVILGAVIFLAFPRPSTPLERLTKSNFDELSCSDEIVALSMNELLYSDPLPDIATFLSGREIQEYEGVSRANSRAIYHLIVEGRARKIYGFGFNGVTLRNARITASEQLTGTLSCNIYLPSGIQYGPVGERAVHIRSSNRTASSIEVIIARSHVEIVEFLTQELAPSEPDNATGARALLPPSSGN